MGEIGSDRECHILELIREKILYLVIKVSQNLEKINKNILSYICIISLYQRRIR